MQDPQLAAELVEMIEHDLRVRAELASGGRLYGGYSPEMTGVHRENGDRLAEVLDEFGCWPGWSIVGIEGSRAAWMIAQHDIANPVLMRRSLALLSKAVAEGEAAPQDLAHLTDRVRFLEGREQVYGTQLDWGDDGRFGIWPAVEDPARVNERRRAVGLSPLRYDAQDRPEAPSDRPRNVLTARQVADWRAQEREFAESVGWRPPPGL